MFTNKFAVNRSVLRVLVYGWQKEELPAFQFKFRSRKAGSLNDVIGKFSSDIHLLIVAEDAVDTDTKKILNKGYYAEKDACYYVEGKAVKDDFGLNGHSFDNDTKNILVYGFEDPLEPEVVPIFRQSQNGSLKDVLTAADFDYAAAVVLESRPADDDEPGDRVRVLDDETRGYLETKALQVDAQNGFHYYILPYSLVQEIAS